MIYTGHMQILYHVTKLFQKGKKRDKQVGGEIQVIDSQIDCILLRCLQQLELCQARVRKLDLGLLGGQQEHTYWSISAACQGLHYQEAHLRSWEPKLGTESSTWARNRSILASTITARPNEPLIAPFSIQIQEQIVVSKGIWNQSLIETDRWLYLLSSFWKLSGK